MINDIETKLVNEFNYINDLCLYNSNKILRAFHEEAVSVSDFNGTTGYGYGDVGRDKLERVYAKVFNCEDALVRNQLISGTHAISTVLFGILRPGDNLLSICGRPYDTLWPIIGLTKNDSSLDAFNVNYKYIDLIDNDFDYESLGKSLVNVKMVHIQRSIGYGNRNTISIEQLKKVIEFIKNIDSEIIVFVDNCYCELCSKYEPTDVGADIVAGSLIKNLGAGICNNGAYICGKSNLIKLCSERLTTAGQGKEVGPSQGMTKAFFQGLYLAPSVVASSLKVKCLTRELCFNYGIDTINNDCADIVLGICFNDRNKLINYVKLIQENSAIDSMFVPVETDMPGYDDKIIMASGSFVDGSSIELSCDAPIREPYIAYQQGSLTYEYGKIAVYRALKEACK